MSTHTCHRCGSAPTLQWQRRATDAEALAQRSEIEGIVGHPVDDAYVLERYGEPRAAVFGCAEHDLSPAPADQTPDALAAAKQSGLDLRALVHAADCGGHGHCACKGAAS
jgi:hypothetical protein